MQHILSPRYVFFFFFSLLCIYILYQGLLNCRLQLRVELTGVGEEEGKKGSRHVMTCLEPQVSFFNYIFIYLYTKECLVIGDSYEWS